MDAIDRNFLRLSGRLRAVEQLLTVLLIDWARKTDDPIASVDAARRNSMLTLQMQDRPIDDATDVEVGAMIDALVELFRDVRAHLE